MADQDFLMQAALGALEGFSNAYVPYKKLEAQTLFEQKQKRDDRQAQLEQFKAEQPYKIQQKKAELDLQSQNEQRKFNREGYLSTEDLPAPTVDQLQMTPGQRIRKEALAPSLSAQKPDTQGVTLSLREQQQQDKLYGQEGARFDKAFGRGSGGLGREDQKVNSAVHARNLIEGARNPKTGEFDINQIQSPELALSLANIVSNSSNANVETFRAMQPQALSKDIKEKLGYIFGKPVDVLPKDWTDNLIHMLDRQATTAEDLRDKYYEGIANTVNPHLNKEMRDRLINEKRGNSYRDTFGIPKGQMGTNTFKQNQELAAPAIGGGDGGYAPDVIAYAQKHKITPDQAQQIKAQRTTNGMGR